MQNFWYIILLSSLPAIGNLIGSLLAEWIKPARKIVGIALHGAVGVATGVVAIELIPRALRADVIAVVVVLFLLGAASSILLALLIFRMKSGEKTGHWRVFAAVAIDLFSDGMMVGIGSAVATSLGIILGISQVFGNIPGGFASTSNLQQSGLSRRRRLGPILLLPIPALIGGGIGFLLLRNAGDAVQGGALAFISGLLLLATVEDTVPEADQSGAPRVWSSAAVAGGFALMLVISGLSR